MQNQYREPRLVKAGKPTACRSIACLLFFFSMSSNISSLFSLQSWLEIDPWCDEMLAVWVPIVVYWVYCTLFELLMRAEIPFFEQYRIHPSSDMTKRNKASFRKVLLMVALQHAVQFCLGMVLLRPTDPNVKRWKEEAWLQYFTSLWFGLIHNKGFAHSLAQITQNIIIPSVQFFTAM